MTTPVRVAVTGPAGSIGYSLLFRIAAGDMLGPNTPIILQLVEIPPAMKALEGVVMELEDGAFDLLAGIEVADNPQDGFDGANICMLIGGRPRTAGMQRADLVQANGPIFTGQGQAINDRAADDVRVMVVGNPCNTNALIAMHSAPDVPRERFTAMTRLDENRAKAQLAKKAGVGVAEVSQMAIFGNHSDTMYPHFFAARIGDKLATEVIGDSAWLEGEFISTIQQRGKAIIDARGASSAASAASAAVDHVRSWFTKTPAGEFVSMAVPSDGSYGVEEGVIFSYPVRCDGQGNYEIVQDLQLNDFAKKKIQITEAQLKEEREVVKALLK